MSAISRAMKQVHEQYLLLNLFGGPGTGKSTMASIIHARMKEAGVNSEYISEYAKDKTWEGNGTTLECQPYVTGKQFWRQFRLLGGVDFAVTDSPLITGLLYQGFGCTPDWEKGVINQFHLFNNLNVFLVRNSANHPYNTKGRNQTEEQAMEIDNKTRALLIRYGIPFVEVEIGETLDKTFQKIRPLLVERGIKLPEESWFV